MTDSKSLETLTELDCRLTVSEALASRILQYQNVMPEEILDLLEEAKTTYAFLAPTLSSRLRNLAKKEIEFFQSLYQNSMQKSLPTEGGC